MGSIPSLKGTEATNKFPYVVFCAPPSRTPDYPGDIRYARGIEDCEFSKFTVEYSYMIFTIMIVRFLSQYAIYLTILLVELCGKMVLNDVCDSCR